MALSYFRMWHSAVSVSGKGGEKTGENDLDSDTSLVHSQLRVRGDVSPGQYHSTVMATKMDSTIVRSDYKGDGSNSILLWVGYAP